MSNRTENIIEVDGLSHTELQLLEKPSPTQKYGETLQRAHLLMNRAVFNRLQRNSRDINVFYLPNGGNIGSSVTISSQEFSAARLVTVNKPDQKAIRSQATDTQYRIAGQDYLGLKVFKRRASLQLVPESFVDKGTTIVGMAAQIAHEAKRERRANENPLFVMSPTVRDIGLERLQSADDELQMLGLAGIVVVYFRVLRGLSDNEVDNMDHGTINRETVESGYVHLAKSVREAH